MNSTRQVLAPEAGVNVRAKVSLVDAFDADDVMSGWQ